MGRWFWIYTALVLLVGVGFLVASFAQEGSVEAYRSAPPCGTGKTTDCYELVPGQLTSVNVSQSRSGERDDVVIETAARGALTATLEPSLSAAPHVRTGAGVTAKLYNGHVTLVEVDGFNVASTDNPARGQSDLRFAGLIFIGLGALSFGVPFFLGRRRSAWAAGPLERLQPEVIGTGNLGWSVRPRHSLSVYARYGLVVVLLVVLTLRALLDPARSTAALVLDSVVILGIVALLALHEHNARVFADQHEVGKTDLFGRTKKIPLESVQRAERFSVPTRGGTSRHLVFVGGDGRKAFEVAGPSWDFSQLDQLCREAQIKLSGSYDDWVGAFSLNRRVPGTTNWGVQFLLLLVIMGLVAAYVFVVAGPTSR